MKFLNSRVYTFLKVTFKKALHSMGFDLIRHNIHTSEDVLLRQILRNFNIEVVLDVGANKGQYAKGIIENGYTGKIYSFEPIHSVFEQLKKKTERYSQWSALNFGVGSSDEEIIMNVSENLVSSSILKVSEASLQAIPETRIARNEKIKIITIDSFFFKENIDKSKVLLKLDVQGYELEALKGALKTLPTISVVQVELSFVRVYEAAPLFDEVVNFLEEFGFEIFTIIPGFRDPNTGRMLQADGVFINKSLNVN